MPTHKKPKALRPDEIRAIVDGAEELHRIICQPLISPYCAHYQALNRLGEALGRMIHEISGQDAPWTSRSSSERSEGRAGWTSESE